MYAYVYTRRVAKDKLISMHTSGLFDIFTAPAVPLSS